MSDLGLLWDSQSSSADLGIVGNDLFTTEDLENAVMLSLFTNRRAEPGDILPSGHSDRQGYWADSFAEDPNDKFGSWIWLLSRSKMTLQTSDLAEEYIREALQWLLDDKVADRIDVTVSLLSREVLAFYIQVFRPFVDPVQFKFTRTWDGQVARG